MSRLLLESGPPDALALEDDSGVVLLEDVDAALERRDPLYIRIDRPNWRISWTAGFQVNLHGVVVTPPEAPAGRQLTERPGVPPYYRTWTQSLQQSTLAPAQPPVGTRIDALPPQPPALQFNQRTWLWNYNPNLIAQDRMITGAELTERPPVPPFYRDWSQNLLQRTLHPLPPGIEFTERPPVPPWYRTWAVTLQQSTLAPAAPFSQTDWPLPRPYPYGRTWLQNLLQSTLTPAAPTPVVQTDWPLTSAPIRASNLGTWTAKYNENLVGQDQRVAGQTITDRPGVPPWYRTWSQSLQQSTLAPAPGTVKPAILTGLPPRGHQHPIALRTWINVGVPQELFPSFVTGWDIGDPVNWRRSWVQNLLESTLSTPVEAQPPGAKLTDRPGVPPWFRSWLVSLQQSTLAPPTPFSQTDWPLPRPYPQGRTWLQNLLQSTLAPAAPLPFNQADWPLPRAYPFGPDLRTWTAFYNRNLIGQDARTAGAVITDRPPVTFWYQTWAVTLQQSTLAPPPGAVRPAMITVLPPRGHQHPVALRTWTAQYNANLIGKDELPFAQFVWPPGPAPIFMPDLRTITARHNFDLVDVFPEPVPPGAAQIPGWWYEKWQEIAMRQRARKRPAPDLPAYAHETTPYEPSKTFKVSPRVIEALAQATSIDDIRTLAKQETGQTRNLLNQMIAEHKRRMKDEDDLEVILMMLS